MSCGFVRYIRLVFRHSQMKSVTRIADSGKQRRKRRAGDSGPYLQIDMGWGAASQRGRRIGEDSPRLRD